MPRVLVLRSPGTNCDEETAHAFALAGADVERLHVGCLIRRERRLDEFDIIAFPGGFSYGDDLGAGTVLAGRLRSRLMDDLGTFVDSGRLVIGICNGFQVLVRLGLLPGWTGDKVCSLVENTSGKFEDRWVSLRVESETCPFLAAPGKGWTFRLPVAHGEGRFLVRDTATLERLREHGQVALTYVVPEKRPSGSYPANPNGSVDGIAGITNARGNVLGLMPHPERFVSALQRPGWTRCRSREDLPDQPERAGDGYRFFENALRHVER